MNRLPLLVSGQPVGELIRATEFEYLLNYHSTDASAFASLAMPVRAKSYVHRRLFPLFEMHLPEGYLLAVIRKHFAKLGLKDDFSLLALLAPGLKGRVTLSDQPPAAERGLSLEDLLRGDQPTLFGELVERFALRSPLSGVQPKVLAQLLDKATLQIEDFVVKAWGDDYPHLALNEWLCMSCLRQAKVDVPTFFLSEDERFFILRRFDRHPQGGYWGFEDFCVLQAKSRDEKYQGSYEQLAKSINVFVSPVHKQHAMAQFFKAMVLNQLLQNGDAHLKNFGVLYSGMQDVRLAPIYDVVCTTAYIKNDVQALTLQGTKRFLSINLMRRFGTEVCGLTQKQVNALLADCSDGLRWLNRETSALLELAAPGTRKAMLAHLHDLTNQALEQDSGG